MEQVMSVDYRDVQYCIVQRGMKTPRGGGAIYYVDFDPSGMPAKAWLVSMRGRQVIVCRPRLSAEPALGLKRRLEKETMFEFGYIIRLTSSSLRSAPPISTIDTCHNWNPPTTLNTTVLGCYFSPYLM
jgi:hypothetical protein